MNERVMKIAASGLAFVAVAFLVSQVLHAQGPALCVSPAGELRLIGIRPLPAACPSGWSRLPFPATGPRGPVGPRGPAGPQGVPGSPGGLMCWDLNGNGQADLSTEDRNADGLVTADDCQGARGAQGPAGATGPAGPTGPAGARGATGPQGPAGPTGPQGPAAPSALCTWSNRTYSTGAQCLSGGCQYPSSSNNSVYMVCQANGTWLATNGGRTGNCPSTCGS